MAAQLTGMGLAWKPRQTRSTPTLSREESEAGFDVRGLTMRHDPVSKTRLGCTPIITPSKHAMQRQGLRMRKVIVHQQTAQPAHLLMERGPVRGGWRNDSSRGWSKRTYGQGDRTLLQQRRAWRKVRPPQQARPWATAQYGKRAGDTRHCSPKHSRIRLRLPRATPIKSPGKIQGHRSSYDSDGM